MILAAGGVLWKVFQGPQQPAGSGAPDVPLPAEPLLVSDAPILGDPEADVGIVIFSDSQWHSQLLRCGRRICM